MPSTVLHLSPHPDDEVVGMPATLMALRDAGWRVVNLACGLGRPARHQRRADAIESQGSVVVHLDDSMCGDGHELGG